MRLMKSKEKKIIIYGLLTMLLMILAGCGEVKEEAEVIAVSEAAESLSYEMISVIKTDVISTERMAVSFTQLMQQDAAFTVGGKVINKVYVQRGDEVKAGDLLVELEIGNLEDEIAELEYQTEVLRHRNGFLDKAEEYELEHSYNQFAYGSAKEEDDLTELEKRNDSIKENYTYQREDYSDDIEFNEMEIADKKRQLSESRIYATMSGMVTYVAADLERSVCKKDETIITVIDGTDGIWSLENTDGWEQFFNEGDLIDLSVTSGSSKGEYVVTPYNMSSWGEFLTFSTLEGPENDGVDVGTLGYIEVVLDKVEDAIAIPSDCLYSADDGYYVYVLDSEGMKTIKWVQIGLLGDDYAEIKEGLSVGEQIVRR